MKARIYADCLPKQRRNLCISLFVLLTIGPVCFARDVSDSTRRRTPRTTRLKTIQLPEPVTSSAVSFERALLDQQQVLPPADQRLQFSDISQLAWAAQGVRVPRGGAAGTIAPAQELPMRVYFILPDGLYLYDPVAHALEQSSDDDVRQPLAAALLNQASPPVGGAQVVLAGSSRDFATQYGTQARTAMLLQAGQMAQNIQLQAVALGLTFVGIDNVGSPAARRLTRLPRNLEPLYVTIVGYPVGQVPQGVSQQPVKLPGRRVLMVVPPQGFQDQELAETKRALELAGVSTVVASPRLGSLTGMLGGTMTSEVLLNQVKLGDYAGVVFIGGIGAVDYFSQPTVMKLAQQAAVQRKVLAAIGTAPSILANAGVLRGVRATAYLSEQPRLTQSGANYTGNPVEKDGLIVTATGPLAAQPFAQAILDALAEGG